MGQKLHTLQGTGCLSFVVLLTGEEDGQQLCLAIQVRCGFALLHATLG